MFKIVLLLMLLLVTADAAVKNQKIRTWELKNKQILLAELVKYKDGWVLLKDVSNNTQSLEVKAFSIEDQVYIKNVVQDERIVIEPFIVETDMRRLIPATHQNVLGGKNSCGPNAVANFLLWWDKIGIIALPYREKDLQDKSEKLHKDLERYMSSNNGTSYLEMKKGLTKYLNKYDDFGKNFSFQLEQATLDNIKKLPAGSSITVLSLMTLKKNRDNEGHWVSLVDCNRDGWATLHTWGWKFVGKFVEGLDDKGKEKRIWFEPVLEPSSPHYEWLIEGGGFYIDEDDSIFVLNINVD